MDLQYKGLELFRKFVAVLGILIGFFGAFLMGLFAVINECIFFKVGYAMLSVEMLAFGVVM